MLRQLGLLPEPAVSAEQSFDVLRKKPRFSENLGFCRYLYQIDFLNVSSG